MRLIIAGGRELHPNSNLINGLFHQFGIWDKVHTVVHGGCRGVDTCADSFAKGHGLKIDKHEAKWKELGRSAGPIRNREMSLVADAVLLIWNGKSGGTASMRRIALEKKLPVYECILLKTS